jgi:hypothetical protein
MRTLLAFCLLCAAFSAAAAQDNRGELSRLLDEGHYPALTAFLDANGGRWGAPAAAFAAELAVTPEARAHELRDLDRLLRGGKLDKQGEHIRRELAKLPGSQWHFVIRLERERRALYDRLGWGPGGNVAQNLGLPVEPRLCSDRSSKLAAAMAPLESDGRFAGWRTEEITANMLSVADRRDMRDDLYGGVHWAPCFVYNAGGTRVEIVADAWANTLAPAYTWWYHFDKGTHDYLYKAGGNDWCGSRILNDAVQAQIKARRAAQKMAAPAAPPKSGTLDGMQGASPF